MAILFNKINNIFNKINIPMSFAEAATASYRQKEEKRGENVRRIVTPPLKSQGIKTKLFEIAPFEAVISQATGDDLIYCDPPYTGRHVDYYNGWTEADEARLCQLLSSTPARFILSTWHHNDYRENEMLARHWNRFNVITRDHFYHSGGKIENRRSVVEALVFNFSAHIEQHNHGVVPKPEQLMLLEERAEYVAQQLGESTSSV